MSAASGRQPGPMDQVGPWSSTCHRSGRDEWARFVIYNSPSHSDDVYEFFEQGLEYLVFAITNSPQKAARFDVRGTSYEAKACGGTTDMLMLSTPRYLIDLGASRPPVEETRLPDPRTLQ
jgi:hypothetical protein